MTILLCLQVLNNKYSHSDNIQVMIETMKMAYRHSKIASNYRYDVKLQ